jgi:hypothetical protein
VYIIVLNKNRALDIKAHEEMYGPAELYYNPETKQWAVRISGKIDHKLPMVETLEGGWICKS